MLVATSNAPCCPHVDDVGFADVSLRVDKLARILDLREFELRSRLADQRRLNGLWVVIAAFRALQNDGKDAEERGKHDCRDYKTPLHSFTSSLRRQESMQAPFQVPFP